MEKLHKGHRRSFPLDLLSSSFDKQTRVEFANAQEQQRLVKHNRFIDLLKNDAMKEFTAEETKLRIRSSRITQCRQARVDDKDRICLPAVVSSGKGWCKNKSDCPEKNKTYKLRVKLPFIAVKAPERNPKKGRTCKESLTARGHKEKKVKSQNDLSVDSPSRFYLQTPSSSDEELTYPSFVDQKGLRRRSLSANDISLAGRVNTFLENLSINTRLSESEDSPSEEIEEDFETGIKNATGPDKRSAYEKTFLNSRLEENGLPRYVRTPYQWH